MNIEKLGIKPITRYVLSAIWDKPIKIKDAINYSYCESDKVRELEQQRNEMLEALIEVRSCGKDERMSNEYLDKIIQKADPQHRTYEEIKELYK